MLKNHWIYTQMKQFPLLADLSQNELEYLAHLCTVQMYKAKTLVFMQEEPLQNVYFIHSGRVKIYKMDASGKEQIVSILQRGEMFPHVGFFLTTTYPAYAEAVEKSILFSIPLKDFEQAILVCPNLCTKLFRIMGEKIIDLQNRLKEQMLQNTYEQMISLLLRLTKTNGVSHDGKYKLTIPFTHKDLANMIGTSRETVSRTMNELKKRGWIAVDENGLYIIDVNELQNVLCE
jgi:CRP-like cAMP-binding protein